MDAPSLRDGAGDYGGAGARRRGWSRPVALPDDIDAPGVEKSRGPVKLPQHVLWSGPERTWDLSDRRQRIQVYEMVPTEGTAEDVRRFIDVDELIYLSSDLWLAPHVRVAWSDHIYRLRGLRLAC
jgi:hypothetical protein